MTEPLVLCDTKNDAIAHIILNRPDKRNALNISLLEVLAAAIDAVQSDPNNRVIILSGNGPVFCAGLDLKEASNPTKAQESLKLVAKVLNMLYRSPLPTIAAVHGAAIAGGAGLMSACDLSVAAEGTLFGYPEVRRGLAAGLVMNFLMRQVGGRHARELLLTGEDINVDHALTIGLVNRVVAGPLLLEEALQLASTLLLGAPGALAHTKQLIDATHTRTAADAVTEALAYHLEACASDEAQEGMSAFLEKRQATW